MKKENPNCKSSGQFDTAQHDGPVAFSVFLTRMGRSQTTGWRMRRDGKIATLNIAGKHYVTAAERARFEARALNGEFAKAPVGAAANGKVAK